jgi:hypothetical protein
MLGLVYGVDQEKSHTSLNLQERSKPCCTFYASFCICISVHQCGNTSVFPMAATSATFSVLLTHNLPNRLQIVGTVGLVGTGNSDAQHLDTFAQSTKKQLSLFISVFLYSPDMVLLGKDIGEQ